MNELSVRGVYRRYIVEPRIEFFGTNDPAIVGDPMNLSLKKDIMGNAPGSLRAQLVPLARKVVGPAQFFHTVCDNKQGTLHFVRTWTHIDVRIELVPDANVNAATLANLQSIWLAGIEAAWNNPIPSPGAPAKQWGCARPAEVPCRVSFKLHWVGTLPHHRVAVHLDMGPPDTAPSDQFNWYTSDTGVTARHELGHMVGLLDEYPDPSGCPDREPVLTGTIMDTNTTFIPQRLVQWVADEIGSDLE